MAEGKAPVFVRESTGLVKNVSLLDAITLNMGNMSAGAALATISFTTIALPSLAGVNLVYASLIAFVLSIPQIIVYSIIGRKIRRTGGDYVWVSRTFGGPLGGSLSFMGYVLETQAYFALIVLALVAAIGSVLVTMGNTSNFAINLSIPGGAPTDQFAIGAVVFLAIILLNMLNQRIGYKIVTVTIILGILGIIGGIITLLAAGHQGVVNYINSLNPTNQSMSYSAIASSFKGSSFDLGATISILPFFAIFVYPWVNAGPAVGSELKGTGTARWNVPLASILVVVLLTGAFGTMYYVGGFAFTQGALHNYDLVIYDVFNFWTLAMGVSGNMAVELFLGLAWILWNVGILAYGVIVISRYLLAQGFDRFLPARVAYVNPRTGSPLVAQGIVLVLTVSLVGAVSYLYGSLQVLFAAVIAAMIYFAFVGVSAVIQAQREEKGGTKAILMICGALMTIVFAYITYQFLASPTIWGTPYDVDGIPGYYLAYAYVAGSFIAGLVLYYGSKWYNGKRGIDISLAFKEIPPE